MIRSWDRGTQQGGIMGQVRAETQESATPAKLGNIQPSLSSLLQEYLGQGDASRLISPVLIIGAGRSGSSLLDATLGSHPQIRMLGEMQYAIPRLWDACWN